MESPQNDNLPQEEQMVTEEETLEGALPFDDYGKDTEQLRSQIERLKKEYDEREKVIDRIMEYGTGIENEKALRMYSTPVLKKWEDSLESYRASKLKK
jgi:archaellum component FlaC